MALSILRVTVSAIVIAIIFAACSTGEKASTDGRITFVKGDVLVNGKKASKGSIVQDGTVVKTGDNALCEIVFNERNIIRIFDRSETVLNLSMRKKTIFLKTGTLASVFKKLGRGLDKRDYRLAVTTPTAVVGIRGTSFYVKVENQESTYICDCNGRIEIADVQFKSRQPVAASHHKAYRVLLKNGQQSINPAKMLYHTDAAMENLAARIGVVIDWKTIDSD